MIRSIRGCRPYLPLIIWPVALTIQIGLTRGFSELLRPVFWQVLGFCLLILLLLAGVVVVIFLAYRQFCLWFDRHIEWARLRIDERIAARSGIVTWPASDPLHDTELDE